MRKESSRKIIIVVAAVVDHVIESQQRIPNVQYIFGGNKGKIRPKLDWRDIINEDK